MFEFVFLFQLQENNQFSLVDTLTSTPKNIVSTWKIKESNRPPFCHQTSWSCHTHALSLNWQYIYTDISRSGWQRQAFVVLSMLHCCCFQEQTFAESVSFPWPQPLHISVCQTLGRCGVEPSLRPSVCALPQLSSWYYVELKWRVRSEWIRTACRYMCVSVSPFLRVSCEWGQKWVNG